jgi:hypothetical protein
MTAKFKSLAAAQFSHIARLEEKEDLIPYSFDGTATFQTMPEDRKSVV